VSLARWRQRAEVPRNVASTIDRSPAYDRVIDPNDFPRFDTPTLERGWEREREWDPLANDIPDSPIEPATPTDRPTDTLFGAPTEPSSVSTVRATKVRRTLLAAVMTLGLGVAGAKSLGSRGSNPAAGAATSSPSAHLLTEDLVRLLSTTPDITSVVGSYVPGVGVVISLNVTGVAVDTISPWWSTAVGPIAARFADDLPNDRVLVLLHSAGTGGFTRTIVSPSGSIAEAASYRLTTAVSEDLNALIPNSVTPNLTATKSTTADLTTRQSTATESTSTGSLAPAANNPASPIGPAPSLPIASTVPLAQGLPAAGSITAVAGQTDLGLPTTLQTATTPNSGAVETFDTESPMWKPLSGQWKFLDGSYQQIDNSGFDFIRRYPVTPTGDFSVSVKLAAIEGDLNGGLVLFQKAPGKRAEATVVDLTSSSSYLRWGHYDVAGVYVFDGGAKTFPLIDQAIGATLTVEVQGTRAVVFLNKTRIGEFVPAQQSGTPGLISSQAKIRFDDFTIRSR
jgi:hypothetical protein